MRLCSVVLLLCVLAPLAAQEPTSQYKGWVYHGESHPSPEHILIDSDKDLDGFRERIPQNRPTKKQPAPANNDPLLKHGEVDFSKHVLFVVTRNQTISAYPEFLGTEDSGDDVVLRFRIPEPPPEARPYGWGTYRAVLLPRSDRAYRVKYDNS